MVRLLDRLVEDAGLQTCLIDEDSLVVESRTANLAVLNLIIQFTGHLVRIGIARQLATSIATNQGSPFSLMTP